MKPEQKTKTIFSVAGGKGGVGKSIFSVALGVKLARDGNSVALVDLDLGAANLHTCLGIIKKTPTIADFILKKVPSLEDILLETSQENMKAISGAEFVAGMANPAHWMKLKIMRHVKALPVDYIIIDLGAGVHFNTLDFFGMSDRGIVVTAPEPGAVMNAYSFIKGALFRRLQSVFKKHPEIAPVIDTETKRTDGDKRFTLEWLTVRIKELAPDMLPLIREIERDFCPALVVNRMPEGQRHVLVRNLISLCKERLGLTVEHAGNLPDIPEITGYLLKIPGFLNTRTGKPYLASIEKIADKLITHSESETEKQKTGTDFSDEQIEKIIDFMEGLDNGVFKGSNKSTWKLRMYFKPSEVVDFLINRGLTHEAFYKK
ncbi:MAG TPA: MinD/ParA family protein [Nitrospirae bacterium]|nr:MinD/ParA family protein [Nitrospirota bacterium]